MVNVHELHHVLDPAGATVMTDQDQRKKQSKKDASATESEIQTLSESLEKLKIKEAIDTIKTIKTDTTEIKQAQHNLNGLQYVIIVANVFLAMFVIYCLSSIESAREIPTELISKTGGSGNLIAFAYAMFAAARFGSIALVATAAMIISHRILSWER